MIDPRAEPHHIGADDRGDDAHPADQQRQRHQPQRRGLVGTGCGQRDRHHRDAERDHIGLEQVGGHAGAVADIVADIVGDHRGVAGVVLGDARLDLADQIGADVGRLGEDAAAQPREDRDQRGAEGQRHECIDHGAVAGIARDVMRGPTRYQKNTLIASRPEAGDQHPGDRARSERGGRARPAG